MRPLGEASLRRSWRQEWIGFEPGPFESSAFDRKPTPPLFHVDHRVLLPETPCSLVKNPKAMA